MRSLRTDVLKMVEDDSADALKRADAMKKADEKITLLIEALSDRDKKIVELSETLMRTQDNYERLQKSFDELNGHLKLRGAGAGANSIDRYFVRGGQKRAGTTADDGAKKTRVDDGALNDDQQMIGDDENGAVGGQGMSWSEV